MAAKHENPYAALKTLFHEPNRLAMMSALSQAIDGLTFNDLKRECGLTDGNLSRHLQILAEAGLVQIWKGTKDSRPQTLVQLSAAGRQRFLDYVGVLEGIIGDAAETAITPAPRAAGWNPA